MAYRLASALTDSLHDDDDRELSALIYVARQIVGNSEARCVCSSGGDLLHLGGACSHPVEQALQVPDGFKLLPTDFLGQDVQAWPDLALNVIGFGLKHSACV